MISENMKILKEQYGFDTVAVREQAVDFSKIKGRKILDIGTGSGWMAIVLARRCVDVVTINTDDEALQRAKQEALDENLADRIVFKKADVTRLPFTDNSYDAVFSFDSMHHLPDCQQAVAEMFRVCKPSGWVVIAELNANGLDIIQQVFAEQGEKHAESPCRIDMAGRIVKDFDPQVQRTDLEFTTVFVARKCPHDTIEEIEIMLERLFRIYSQKSRHEMLDSGLTSAQARALQLLSEAGCHRISELSDKLFIENSKITRILDGLVKKGYVKRERSRDDRRAVTVRLTHEGKSIVNNIRCCMVNAQREVLGSLKQSEQLKILAALQTLTSVFTQHET